jgi:uncharacterized protein
MSKSTSAHNLTVIEPLDLRMLPDEGLAFDEALPSAWLEERLSDPGIGGVRVPTPGHVSLRVDPLGAVAHRPPIRVHGHVRAELDMTCVRCLSPLEHRLDGDLDVTLFPEGAPRAARGATEDDELSEAELDEGTYGGESIDLPAILRESMLLELPMNPACEDEAACTVRTEAMIAEANRGSSAVVDDRWAALRHLRVVEKPGEES